MALLRRKAPEEQTAVLDAEPAPGGGKGKPTPKRSEARTGRVITYKTSSDPKTARRQTQLERRTQAQEYRLAMRSGDVSKMPPRERVPERVLTRDIVDGRRNVGPVFLVLALLYFISPVTQIVGVVLLAQLLMLLGLIAVVIDSVLVGRRVTKEIQQRWPGSTVKVRAYAAQRALLPRRWRTPRSRVSAPPLKLPGARRSS